MLLLPWARMSMATEILACSPTEVYRRPDAFILARDTGSGEPTPLTPTHRETDMTSSSREFERARQCIPGGVNSPVRAFRAVGGTPVFFERAEGALLFDIDSRR